MRVGCLKQQISNSMARSLKGKYFTAPIRLYGIKLKKKPKPSSAKYSDGISCNFIKSFKNKTVTNVPVFLFKLQIKLSFDLLVYFSFPHKQNAKEVVTFPKATTKILNYSL